MQGLNPTFITVQPY